MKERTASISQYKPSSPISVQEQPFEVDYLDKNSQSVGINAKQVIIDKSCQYEPVQEQFSEVEYLKKNFLVVVQAKLVMKSRAASMNHLHQYLLKNSLLK